MWAQGSLRRAPADSGTSDNVNQVLSPRMADRLYPY